MTDRYATDRLRLSDAERDQAARALGEHYAAGRLTAEEHDERTSRAFAATTRGELPPLFADLPGGSPLHPSRPGSPTRPAAYAAATPTRSPRSRGHTRGLLRLVLVMLVIAMVVTHLPYILLGLIAWWLLGALLWRGRAGACRRPAVYR